MTAAMPDSDLAEYVRRSVARTRADRTARIMYRRTQDFGRVGAELAPEGGHARRWLGTVVGRVVKKVLSPMRELHAQGVIDFEPRRSELDFDGFRVFLDGDEGYIGMEREGWERARDADQFLALGGPLWLIDLLDDVVTAEVVDPNSGPVSPPSRPANSEHEAASLRNLIVSVRLKDEGASRLVLAITVDADGRIRRISHESELIGGTVRIDLCDYGQPRPLDSPVT